MTLLELAQKLRPYIEKAAISLSDEDALEAVNLFPSWKPAKAYAKDERVTFEGTLYKCLQAHTSQDAWTPTAAQSLWTKVLIPDANVIPEWEQPESTNPYMVGDKVMFEGQVYECTINNNIWAPNVYGWQPI